jgi:BASS family bile acid:Na+ symporter
MMFCLGLGLDRSAFARLLRQPRLLATSLLCQLILTPLLALILARALALEPVLSSGLVLIAACPVTAAATLLTKLARGNLALSVALTAVTSLAAAMTIPPFMGLAAAYGAPQPPGASPTAVFAGAGLWRMGLSLATLASVPVLLGMALRAASVQLADRVERLALRIASTAFLLGLVVAIAATWSQIPFSMAEAGVLVVVLSFAGLVLSYGVSWAAGLEAADRVAVVLGTVTRKFTMASFVALTLLRDARLLLPAIAYCLLMWIPALGVVWLARRSSDRATRRSSRATASPVALPA